jgi:ribonuclease BN (tRNA processing enzyme)
MTLPRIFISHSHKDNAFGLHLVKDLRAQMGEDAIWYDISGGLRGGDEWWNTIVQEITSRDIFIVVLIDVQDLL